MKQDYVLKKFVRASNAAEAIALDTETAVSEVFLTTDKPESDSRADAVGFHTVHPDE